MASRSAAVALKQAISYTQGRGGLMTTSRSLAAATPMKRGAGRHQRSRSYTTAEVLQKANESELWWYGFGTVVAFLGFNAMYGFILWKNPGSSPYANITSLHKKESEKEEQQQTDQAMLHQPKHEENTEYPGLMRRAGLPVITVHIKW